MKNLLGIILLMILTAGCEKTIEKVVVKAPEVTFEVTVNGPCSTTSYKVDGEVKGQSTTCNGADYDQAAIDALQTQIDQLNQLLSDSVDSINNLTTLVNLLTIRVDILEGAERIEFYKLCATSKEYGLKVGPSLYAVYDDRVAQLTYLAKLSAGSYITTDGTNCTFSVNEDGTTTTTGVGTLPGGPSVHPAYQFKITHNNGRVVYLKNVGQDSFELYNASNTKICSQKQNATHQTVCTESGIVVNNRGNHVVIDACNVNNTLNYSVGQTLVDNGAIKCHPY